MGLFSFVKDAGAKLFNKKTNHFKYRILTD